MGMRKHGVCQTGSGRWTSVRVVGRRAKLRPLAGWLSRLGARRMSLGSRLRGRGGSRGLGLEGRGRCGLGLSGHSRLRRERRGRKLFLLRCKVMKMRRKGRRKKNYSWNGKRGFDSVKRDMLRVDIKDRSIKNINNVRSATTLPSPTPVLHPSYRNNRTIVAVFSAPSSAPGPTKSVKASELNPKLSAILPSNWSLNKPPTSAQKATTASRT